MVEFQNLQELVIAAMDFLGKNKGDTDIVLNDCFLDLRTYKSNDFLDFYYITDIHKSNINVYFGCTKFSNSNHH